MEVKILDIVTECITAVCVLLVLVVISMCFGFLYFLNLYSIL